LFEEPITSNFDVPVGVSFGGGELLPPPHAIATLKMTNIQKRADHNASFRLACFRPAGNKAKAERPRAASGIAGFGREVNPTGNARSAAFDPVVVTVRLVVVVALLGVICAGVKVEFAPVGSPEQDNTIAVFKLGTDATVIVNVADPPADTVALVADEVRTNGAAFVPTI
jgi:hypothetical protein